MTYEAELPKLFPWRGLVDPLDTFVIAATLVSNYTPVDDEGTMTTAGSSFAIVSGLDAGSEKVRVVWLSDTSYRRLKLAGLLPEVDWQPTTKAWL